MTGPKIGLIDIETMPLVSYTWGIFDQNVGLNQIATEWSVLSFCLKPLRGGKNTIEYMDTSQMDDPRDDHAIIQRLDEVLNEYDVLVAHNGKRFDLRKIRARLILLGYPPHSPVKVEDTLLMAKQVGSFTSNKLEWLSTYLSTVPKDTHREFPGFELWAECLKKNPKAFKALRKYNIPDVLSLEQVYLRLRPWYQGGVNVAVYMDGDDVYCPVCGGAVVQDGYQYTQSGKYERYHCTEHDCGAWSRGRYTRNSLSKRKSILTT